MYILCETNRVRRIWDGGGALFEHRPTQNGETKI